MVGGGWVGGWDIGQDQFYSPLGLSQVSQLEPRVAILGEYWANIEQILGDIGQILARLHTTRIVTMYQGPRITDSTQL